MKKNQVCVYVCVCGGMLTEHFRATESSEGGKSIDSPHTFPHTFPHTRARARTHTHTHTLRYGHRIGTSGWLVGWLV